MTLLTLIFVRKFFWQTSQGHVMIQFHPQTALLASPLDPASSPFLPSFLPLCSPELAHLCGSFTHLLTHTPSLPNPEALSSRKGCLFLYQITPAWLWQCGCERLWSPCAASRHFSPTLVKSWRLLWGACLLILLPSDPLVPSSHSCWFKRGGSRLPLPGPSPSVQHLNAASLSSLFSLHPFPKGRFINHCMIYSNPGICPLDASSSPRTQLLLRKLQTFSWLQVSLLISSFPSDTS